MDWGDIKDAVASVAPTLGTALAGPAGGAVGGMLATALGVDQTPEAVSQAIKADPQAAVKLREVEAGLERAQIEAGTKRLETVNETIRTEAKSDDAYVRRWRPTFGYLVALAWLLQSCAIGLAVVSDPAQAGNISQAVTALTPMWSVALAILGINVHNRSQDKRVAAGQNPGSFMDAIKTRVAGK